jgi:hypothetical protein
MVVNFRAREISRGTRKLARTPTLNKKKKKTSKKVSIVVVFEQRSMLLTVLKIDRCMIMMTQTVIQTQNKRIYISFLGS